jgi:hypothetical protein
MNFRERLADAVSGGTLSRLREDAAAGSQGTRHYRDRALHLEATLSESSNGRKYGEDGAWAAVGDSLDGELTREEHREAVNRARSMFLRNPLIRRGVNVQAHYVFGQGVEFNSPDPDANIVLQEFKDDPLNQAALTGATVGGTLSRLLNLEGSIPFVFFVNKATGRVKVRRFRVNQIEDWITNPSDDAEIWFYEIISQKRVVDMETGNSRFETVREYHPDWRYNPASKRATIGRKTVRWDAPIYHVKALHLDEMLPPPTVFSELAWAAGYARFLEHRATVAAALSKFVYKFKSGTKQGIAATASKLGLSGLANLIGGGEEREPRRSPFGPGTADTGRPDVGNTALMGEGRDVEAIGVKGATINPEEGRAFKLMVCAGSGKPETFYGDVDRGSLATATSIDRPTELQTEEERQLWIEVLTNIGTFVLVRAARAALNPFSRVARVEYAGVVPKVVRATGEGAGKPVLVDVDFPPILEHETDKRMTAIDTASKWLPFPRLLAKMALSALGENDIDDLVKNLPDYREPPAPTTKVPGDKANNNPQGDTPQKEPAKEPAPENE